MTWGNGNLNVALRTLRTQTRARATRATQPSPTTSTCGPTVGLALDDSHIKSFDECDCVDDSDEFTTAIALQKI